MRAWGGRVAGVRAAGLRAADGHRPLEEDDRSGHEAKPRSPGCRQRVVPAATLQEAYFGGERFDKVFAVNVALFWRQPREALGIVRGLLAPDGALYVIGQAPGWTGSGARSFAEGLAPVFEEQGFRVDHVQVGGPESGHAFCVRGVPL